MALSEHWADELDKAGHWAKIAYETEEEKQRILNYAFSRPNHWKTALVDFHHLTITLSRD